MKKWIWISWEKHRRTQELCDDFDIPLFVKEPRLKNILRHPLLILWTLLILLTKRPEGLLVQNPSIVLACMAVFLRVLLKYILVVDAHNAAIEIGPQTNYILRKMRRFVLKSADLTIITNSLLAETVKANGGHFLILPDRIPDFPLTCTDNGLTNLNVVCITRFAADEPYEEIIEAAKIVDENVKIYMTGNPARVRFKIPSILPKHLILTGFIPDDEYLKLLAGASVVLDFTNRPDCLVCGAYEAVSLGLPLILSDTPALRKYFTRGCVYTDHSPKNIAAAISEALANMNTLRTEIAELRLILQEDWKQARISLARILSHGLRQK